MSKAIEERELSPIELVKQRRAQIYAGPWVNVTDVYGQSCHLCGLPIFSKSDAYGRLGDELSPALYRHKQCHEDSVSFTAEVRDAPSERAESAQESATTLRGRK